MAKPQKKSTRTKDGLAMLAMIIKAIRTAIKEQRNEIDEYMDCVRFALEGLEGTKKRKLISFDVERLNMERDAREPSQLLRVNMSNVYYRLSWDALCSADSASTRAIETIKQGHIEDSLKYYICAERSIGAELAFAQVGNVESEKAKAKAKRGHGKTYAKRARLISYWRDNIDPKLSASKAAAKILGMIFTKDPNREVIAYRTLVDWISEEKKKLSAQK